MVINKLKWRTVPVSAVRHGAVDEWPHDEGQRHGPGDEVVVSLFEIGVLGNEDVAEMRKFDVGEAIQHLGSDEGGPKEGGEVEVFLVGAEDAAHVVGLVHYA